MAETSTNFGLLIHVRRAGPEPLHRQIEVSIREAIRSGRLRLGTSLPPTRTLANDLGVSRGVVVEAYQQLVAEGYLTSRSGGYTQVAAGTAPEPDVATADAVAVPVIDFGYGRADVAHSRVPRGCVRTGRR
jgi:GntR family transcriptional regulator / MocR family aminotransferase